jgi:hypothetical protein
VQAQLAAPGTDDERATAFLHQVMRELATTVGRAEADGYVSAGRFDFSWGGLARYWRKKAQSGAAIS